jgi:TIR domain
MAEPVQLYICFAEENKNALSRLEKQLRIPMLAGTIQLWHRGKVEPGIDRAQRIATHLDQARIIIMLVSASLFDPKYYDSSEIQHAFQLHKEQKARLVPVIVAPCVWQEDLYLGSLEPLPRVGKPAGLDDKAWLSVVEEINKIARQIQAEQAQKEPAPAAKSSKPRTKSRKVAGSKSQPFSGAAVTNNAATPRRSTKRPQRSTPPPVPTQPTLPERTLPAVEEPESMSAEAGATTPAFKQDYDRIRDDMMKIVFTILIWEPSQSTHDLIANERRAIHQALMDQRHRTMLGSTLPVPEGASLQDCEITQANTSDITFVIVEPEISSVIEWREFYRIYDEAFLNKTYCYYPEIAKTAPKGELLDENLCAVKRLYYYKETEITNCHIRTEVLNWVQTKRTLIYRSGQRSRSGR